MKPVKNIIFDLGGVLMDWNPEYLFNSLFEDKNKMQWFLENVCNSEWNVQQDAGRSFAEAVNILIDKHPEYEKEIKAYDEQWETTIKGTFPEAVDALEKLAASGKYRIFALTNWSAEKFPLVRNKYAFYDLFEDILVSGEEKLIKPDPEIFKLAISRFEIEPTESLFIDDNLKNIEAAQKMGFQVIHYKGTEDLNKFPKY
ncbi:HAD family hydrolase [Chondrinema litorale]|uniref:HAD family hydrolase n=1 Tax=Chondrinema litorale TaxID=2994555 RepID=UPI00254271B1|nr:HAD family phosphatase [Chondrinema litorale]UZR93836.1 HAD family phosphatase [Chondrinema litorale]